MAEGPRVPAPGQKRAPLWINALSLLGPAAAAGAKLLVGFDERLTVLYERHLALDTFLAEIKLDAEHLEKQSQELGSADY